MATRCRPSSSSAPRIAPTMPSIMPLGATTSAPASPCETAIRPRVSSVSSFSTSPVVVEQPAVAVVRVLADAHVGDDDEFRKRVLERAIACWTTPSSAIALEPVGILGGRDTEEEDGFHSERGELARLGRERVHRDVGRRRASTLRADGRHRPARRRAAGRGRLARASSRGRGRAAPRYGGGDEAASAPGPGRSASSGPGGTTSSLVPEVHTSA